MTCYFLKLLLPAVNAKMESKIMLQTFKLETEHCEKKMMAYKLCETTLAVRSSLIKLSKTLEPW